MIRIQLTFSVRMNNNKVPAYLCYEYQASQNYCKMKTVITNNGGGKEKL